MAPKFWYVRIRTQSDDNISARRPRMRHDTSESVRCVMIHRRVSECVMTHDDSKSQRYPSQQAVTQTQSRSGARFTSGPCTSCRRGLLVAMDPSQKRTKEVSHRSVCLRLGVVLVLFYLPPPANPASSRRTETRKRAWIGQTRAKIHRRVANTFGRVRLRREKTKSLCKFIVGTLGAKKI